MIEQFNSRSVRLRLVEAFAALNLAFLSVDIWLAHSANSFAEPEEWIPIPFGIVAIVLLPGIRFGPSQSLARWSGFGIGLMSAIIGLLGVYYHLEATFFEEQTLKSLVYTAPFAAPLAYVGVGLLLWLNRIEGDQPEWGRWVILLAWGGFLGNFVLALLDHAQNGFFEAEEWISVAAAAMAVGFLIVAVFRPRDIRLLWSCVVVLLIESATGVLGTWLHLKGNMQPGLAISWDQLIYGAPVFAPLLFPNLALLAAIGLWDIMATEGLLRRESTEAQRP